MVPAHKVAGAPAPRSAEARLDGAGRSQLRAIKVAVRNVGGMSADTLFIRACRLAGRIDILVLIEVKVRGLDELRALVKMIFPEDTPDVVGVPCERDVHLAADGTQARQEVYGGIVAIILNRNIRATLTKEYDGVVSVACETAGMRPFCIIGCYLPPAPKAGKCRRRFLTVPARLDQMVEECQAAQRKRQRVLVVGDFNVATGSCHGHFSVNPKRKTSAERRCQLLDAWDRCGLSPLHGRSRARPAHPTSFAHSTTAEGLQLAWSRGEHPGNEVDYVLGCTSWREGCEYELFDRGDVTVPHLGGPLHPDDGDFHPKGPPRHDMLVVQLNLEEDSVRRRLAAAAPLRRLPKVPQVAGYGSGTWHVAADAAVEPLEAWRAASVALEADDKMGTPAACDAFEAGVSAINAVVRGAQAGHSRECPPEKARRRGTGSSHRSPAMVLVHTGIKMRQRDKMQLRRQLQRGTNGRILMTRENELLLTRLEVVEADLRVRLQRHKALFRSEMRRLIQARGQREEALLRWDAHSAARNLKRECSAAFALRGKISIPDSVVGGVPVPAAKRFRDHIAKLLQRPVDRPRLPATQALLAISCVHAVGVALAAAPVPHGGAMAAMAEGLPPLLLPPVQFYDAHAAHGLAAQWAWYWACRARSLDAAKDAIRRRVHEQLAQLQTEAHPPDVWAVPLPSELPEEFQRRVKQLVELHATLLTRKQACIQSGMQRCCEMDHAHAQHRADLEAHRACHACPELHAPVRHLYAALRDCCPSESPGVLAGTAAAMAISIGSPVREAPPVPHPLHVPHADGAYLQRDVTAYDVYVLLFPPDQQVRYCCITGMCLKPDAVSACPTCAKYNAALAAWKPDDIRSEAPEFPTQLRTGKAAGLGDAVAEVFRWLRPKEEGLRLEFRLKICQVLARFFTGFLRRGIVPKSFKQGLCMALLKAVKPGARADPSDPDYYRFITVAGVMPKLFGCVLLTRLSHWSDRTGLTSDSQNAFRAERNCEQHVISLIEVLRARRRGGRATWMLFVDFRKAYDSVDHEALWEVLRHAGVPPALVALLREWNTGRTATLAINGELADPFDITLGVPQGDVLSPWLFNLFVESLIRTIRADTSLQGVHEFGITIKELMYADDLAMPCASRAQAQRALEIVTAWCRQWGMQISGGHGKTEVLVFDEKPPLGGWRPLVAGDVRVPVGDEYRYLGLAVNTHLEYAALLSRYATSMWANYNRFFRSNSYVRHMSLRAQSIQLRTFVLSASTFLAAALPAHMPELAHEMDKRLLDMLGNMLHLDRKVVTGSLSQEGRVPMTLHTWVRERTRVYLEALSTTTHNPRILLHRILMRQTAPAFRHPCTWIAETERVLATYGFRPQHCLHCHSPHDGTSVAAVTGGSLSLSSSAIKQQASCLARHVATTLWAREILSALAASKRQWPLDGWLARPPAAASEFRFWLFCGYLFADILTWAGIYKHSPFSFTAPGGSGNIICNAEVPPAMASILLQARQGSSAHRSRDPDGGFTSPKVCAACGAAAGDPFHFMFECTHATCRAAQCRAQKLMRDCAAAIIDRTRDMAKHPQVPELAAKPMLDRADDAAAALAEMDAAQWASPAGVATLARLSYAQPWSARHLSATFTASSAPASRLATALGRLFDSINWPPCITRRLCTQWVFKASKAHRLCNEARDATHPAAPAHRRGGGAAHDAAVEEKQELDAVAAAAADANEAAAIIAARGSIPRPPPKRRGQRQAQRRRDAARSGANQASPAGAAQRTLPYFFRRSQRTDA